MPRDKAQTDDSVADLLINQPFPALASALRGGIDATIGDWEKLVLELLPDERKLSETQLRDHLPRILELMADILGEDDPEETRRLLNSPIEHSDTRFDQHYDTAGFIIEYRLLRRVLVTQLEGAMGRRLEADEDLALDMTVDSMLQRGIVAFVNRQEQKLQSAAKAEKKYLSFLSHDLRNNLSVVVMELEQLKRRLSHAAELADVAAELELAQRAVFETVDGMDRLLQTERLRQGAEPVITAVDMHGLIEELSRRFQRRATEKGLTLTADVTPGLTIHSDRELLTLALQNLVGNAVKFSSAGGVRLRCRRSLPKNGPNWTISVADDGPGIAPNRLKSIFEMFSRGETHGQDGVGLGLAVASQAAKLLGAELNVKSKLGAGTTFELLLPEKSGQP